MALTSSNKRRRLPDEKPTPAQFVEIVDELDQSDVRKLLTQAAQYLGALDVHKLLVNAAVSNELVGTEIAGRLAHIQLLCKRDKARKVQEERYPPLKLAPPAQQAQCPATHESEEFFFNANIEKVDYYINKELTNLNDAEKYDKAPTAATLVNLEIAKIKESATYKSDCETKINAVLALCNTGSTVMTGGDCIGDEVRARVGHEEFLVNAMSDIMNSMSHFEIMAFRDDIVKLENFNMKRRIWRVFDGFRESSILSRMN
ncbi:hypothetical protein KCU81_g4250, partial [Aureobasidium melanogenum]|uniref:Uncharacterized protein n=1 Tax=Aureobasidium melanogenum (strain CBS 110374) TaxID=1043003 RepID=A0A074WB79_AURM1